MKKIIVLLNLVAGINNIQAQNTLSTYCFQINNQIAVKSKVPTPNSIVKFYSEVEGGSQVYSETTDEQGNSYHFFDEDKLPAFVLSNKRVYLLNEIEFCLQNLVAERINNQVQITFNASSQNSSKTNYQIVKIINDVETIVATYTSSFNNISESYSCQDNMSEGQTATTYMLRVNHSSKGVRYEEVVLNNNLSKESKERIYEGLLLVYPTIANDFINIHFDDIPMNCTYNIFDFLGKKIEKGSILENRKINISHLSNGRYIIYFPNIRRQVSFLKSS